MFFFLVLFFGQSANAQLIKNDIHLVVENIEVVERQDRFSLEIAFQKTEKTNILLNFFDYSGKENKALTIDIDENLARAVIKLSPEIPFTLTSSQQGLILLGNFTPETDYTLSISTQLKDKSGIALKEAISKPIHIGSYKPQFTFLNKTRFIPPNLQEHIGYETINLEDVEVSIRQIYNQNIHQLLSSRDRVSDNLSDVIKHEKIHIKNKNNKKIKGSLSLENIHPLGQGFFYLEARANNIKLDSTILVITELGAVLKLGENQSLRIWTFKGTSLNPLPGTQITLYSESNFQMGQCTSQGARGYCEIKWTSKNRIPFAVSLKKGLDQSYLRLSDLLLPSDSFDGGRRNYFLKNKPYDAFIYSERNLYRAGEIIHFAVQVRKLNFESASSLPITWKIFDPTGNQYKEFITKTSDFGTATLDLPTNLLYANGPYTIEAHAQNTQLNTYKFYIESFIPERFTVKLIPEKSLVINKTQVRFDIQANQFDTEAIDAEFTAHCNLEEAFHLIPNHPEYQTGTYIPNGQNKISVETLSGKIKKDEKNYYQCDFTKLLSNLPNTPYKADTSIFVSEESSLNPVTYSTNTILSAVNSNLGIKALQNLATNSVHIEGMIFDLAGNLQNENHKIIIELLQIQENWITIQQNNENKEQVIETINPKSINKTIEAKAGLFEVQLTPPIEWRKWLVRATDVKTKMMAEFPLDSLISTSESTKFEPINIKTDKSNLIPGEKFKVTLTPPFFGELLVGIESFKVFEQQWLHIDKIQPIELELKAPAASPNFYVTALLLKEPLKKNNQLITNRAWGAQSLRILPKKNTLNVQISAPVVIESLRELSINISNKEKVRSEYSIAVIDEDLLNATEFIPPNPIEHFFDARKLNSKTFDSLDSSLNNEQTTDSLDDKISSLGSLNNKNLNLVHFWFPHIKSDRKGLAEIKIKVPHFSGKLKIFVVGSAFKHMGSAESIITVSDPLKLRTLPEYFTVNDSSSFKLKLFNFSESEDDINVSLGTIGPVSFENTQFNKKIKAGSEDQIQSEIRILDYPIPITINLISEHKKTAKLWQEDINLPTYPNGIEQFLLFDTLVNQRLDLITALPPIWKKNYLKVHLSLSNVPFIGAFSYLSSLWNYPYGNLEQTVSKILPLIADNDLLSLAEGVDPKILANSVHTQIQTSLDQIMSQQTLDGGFSLWPNENISQAWASAYATLALSEAINNKYSISTNVFNKALSYLQKNVETAVDEWEWYENENPELSLALYVLAKNKKKISPLLNKISDKLTQLNTQKSEAFGYENLFLLVMAAKSSHNSKLFNKIMSNKSLAKKIFFKAFDEKPFSSSNFWSSIRMDGLRLSILLELWPKHKAVSTLTKRITKALAKAKTYFNTQDLSWPLFAFSKLLKTYKINTTGFKDTKLLFNGKYYKSHFEVRGIPVWYFYGDELLSSSFQFSNLEKTKYFYHTKVSGFTMGPPPSLSPINIERAYLLPDGSEADETELKTGDQIIVELKVFNPRSIHFRSVALVDRIPAGFLIDNINAYSEDTTWMSKNIFQVEHINIFENQLQIFGELTDSEKYFYYQVRVMNTGKFKAPSTKIELMYDPESFDFSSEATIGVSH